MGQRTHITQAIKREASRLGFDGCGISRAERLDDEAQILESWLNAGMHGSMGWMERNFEKRIDPTKLVPGAKSVISLIESYYQPMERSSLPDTAKISRYAWGEDYHYVLKEKLFSLYNWLDESVGGISGRAFVDSAPVMDKAWAQRSGLGWIGKHTNVLNRSMGSYFFIGEIIVDLELDHDDHAEDHCGSCTRCIDACPTDAIYQPYAVDARKCISYLTIENRDHEIAEVFEPHLEKWVFGCDICQEVCPWNKFKRVTSEPRYMPRDGMLDTTLDQYEELDIEEFRERFRRTPVKRAKYEGLLRNVKAAKRGARLTPPASPSEQ
jgi:epoxyqueuosine reductase